LTHVNIFLVPQIQPFQKYNVEEDERVNDILATATFKSNCLQENATSTSSLELELLKSMHEEPEWTKNMVFLKNIKKFDGSKPQVSLLSHL
jgi:hypothetical protein